jgi:microcompartment protein CcmL/EutN
MGAGDRRHLNRKLQAVSASDRPGMLKTKKQACASEGYGILKAKKEALAAVRLLRFNRVPGGSDIWMDHGREMKAKGAVKKGKRVVKQRLPKALIDLMVARPFRSVEDLTPVQLAKRSHEFRQFYALTTFVDAKLRDYEQALIRQYNAKGYAEDESEVTDSEEDATVVEN